MKKLLAIMILCVVCVCCAVGFAACDNDGKSSGGDETHTHIYDSGVITKQPNCTKQGEITFSCECGATYTAKVPVLGHDYKAEIIAPTCTEQGYTKHTCVKCGDSYKNNYVEKLEHNYEWTTTKQPTETEDGIKTGVCKLCGDRITKIIPSLNHEHNYIITIIEPTCTKNGYTLHKCACGDKYIDNETAALGHTPAAAIEENIQKATCTENGSYDSVVYCTVCHTELTREEKTIPATGHEFVNYVSDGNATYESDGTKTAYCNNGCGTTATVPDIGSKLVYSGITFNTLTASGTNVNGKVPNSQNTFSFLTEINVSGGATYSVSYDINGNNTIPNKTVNLNIGDNIFYVLAKVNGEASNLFTVTIRRRPIYTVSFNSNGGTSVASQQIEEDSFVTEPTTERTGYTFTEWDYDFTKPIIKSTTITASWAANTNTKYKVEYYLQNLEDNNYTLHETENLTGETDKQATAEIKTFEHFTHTTISNSIESANINCDETTKLKVYYTRDKYTIKLVAGENVTLNRSYNGSYKYGYQIEEITATVNNYLGYEWKGWHNGDNVLTYDKVISAFTVKEDLNYTADFAVKVEMQNFNFTSITTECEITGVKNNNITEIIIPDYITSIGRYAFYGCSSLTSITIGDSVTGIGEGAFACCSNLTSITIPDSVTSIGSSAFSDCRSLTSISVSENNSYYSSQDGILYNKEKTGIVDAPEGISGAIELPNTLTSIGRFAFYNCSSLTSIIIPDSVTSIGEYAFYNCSSLTSIIIPNGVTYIRYNTFYNCSSLTSITIPDSVTLIDAYAFRDCSSLLNITIGKKVASIGGEAFNGCCHLVEVYNKSSLTITVGSVGNGCVGLYALAVYTSPYESKISTENDGYIVYTDGDNKILVGYNGNETELTLPCFVTEINHCAFYNCSGLTSITMGNNVTSIGSSAFDGCSGLTSIYYTGTASEWASIDGLYNVMSSNRTLYINNDPVKNIVLEGITEIKNNAFYYCTSLESVTIGNGVTIIGKYAFYNCSSLTSIIIPDSVTGIRDSAFAGCYKLAEVINKSTLNITKGNSGNGYVGYYALTVHNGESKIVNEDGYLVMTDNGTNYLIGYNGTETKLALPDNYNGENYKINKYAFYNCSSLTSIIIPDSVTSIGDSAFAGCSGLMSITIPFVGGSKNTASETHQNSVGYIFGTSYYTGGTATTQYYNGSSTTYYIPSSLKTVTVTGGTILYGVFRNCSSLESVTIGNGVTSIGSYAFYDCSSLESVTIGNGVTSIGSYSFNNCSSLESVTIGNGVTSIGSWAFYDCSSLESVTIGNSVTSIGQYAFSYCSSLKEITIPDSVASIGQYAFSGCPIETATIPAIACSYIKSNNLKTVTITSGECIGNSAFSGCSSLKEITIPDSVTSIVGRAFSSCSSLTTVYYNGTAEEWERISIGSSNTYLTKAKRYYYSETKPTGEGNYWHYENGEIVVWAKEN